MLVAHGLPSGVPAVGRLVGSGIPRSGEDRKKGTGRRAATPGGIDPCEGTSGASHAIQASPEPGDRAAAGVCYSSVGKETNGVGPDAAPRAHLYGRVPASGSGSVCSSATSTPPHVRRINLRPKPRPRRPAWNAAQIALARGLGRPGTAAYCRPRIRQPSYGPGNAGWVILPKTGLYRWFPAPPAPQPCVRWMLLVPLVGASTTYHRPLAVLWQQQGQQRLVLGSLEESPLAASHQVLLLRRRMPFSVTSNEAPMSAKTAIHSVARPGMARAMKAPLIRRLKAMF